MITEFGVCAAAPAKTEHTTGLTGLPGSESAEASSAARFFVMLRSECGGEEDVFFVMLRGEWGEEDVSGYTDRVVIGQDPVLGPGICAVRHRR